MPRVFPHIFPQPWKTVKNRHSPANANAGSTPRKAPELQRAAQGGGDTEGERLPAAELHRGDIFLRKQ